MKRHERLLLVVSLTICLVGCVNTISGGEGDADGVTDEDGVTDGDGVTDVEEEIQVELAPSRHKSTPFATAVYSTAEEKLIVEILTMYAKKYDGSTWTKIEEAINDKYAAETPGFKYERTRGGIMDHFYHYMMMKERPENAVIVPDSLRKIFRKPTKRFTAKENAFINDQLYSHPVCSTTSLLSYETWEEIRRNHEEMRKLDPKGFPVERSLSALKNRFYRMKEKNMISDAVKRKHPEFFYFNEGSSSKGSAKARKMAPIDD